MKTQFLLLMFVFCFNVVQAQKDKYGNTIFKSNSKTLYKDTAGNLIPRKDFYKLIATKQFSSKSIEDTVKFKILEMQLIKLDSSRIKKLTGETHKNMLGQAAPEFEFTDIENKVFRSSDLREKVIVLNFWFIGCAPCRKEIPELNKIKRDFVNEDIVFIAIALDNAVKLRQFFSENEFLYAHIADGKTFAEKFSVSAYPTNVVIDKAGKFRYISTGFSNNSVKELAREIKNSLKN